MRGGRTFPQQRSPKFDDCTGCRFFKTHGRYPNPICNDCGAGEFFESKPSRRLTDNELINEFRSFYDE